MTKLAALFGCNYEGMPGQLNGCINDVLATKQILIDKFGYTKENIHVLTDHTATKPTKHNIVKTMMSLAERSWQEEVTEIWMSYSGHGTYQRDKNNDEDDGRDECLVPLDHEKNGLIDDDTMNSILTLFHPSVNLVFIIDACHSGTILDLPYRYLTGSERSVKENAKSRIKCNAMMISGCRDKQTSMDAYNINNDSQYSGAMTSALLFVLEKYDYTIHVHTLLVEMRKFLKEKKFKQVAQVSATKPIKKHIMFSINQTFKAFVC
mgnify:CR=1 FL=1